MQESEITADITKENFEKYIARFTRELGKPVIKHRISFMVLERGKPLDNRIKITNGKARIVQKLKAKPDSRGKRISQETEIDIPDDLESVKMAIRLFTNFYETYEIETLRLIVQHENYLWETEDYELKIARQFGKQEIFLYEIETLGKKTPEEIEDELGMKADFDTFSPERQALRRGEVDVPFDEFSEEEIDELILKYLSYRD